MNLRIGLVRTSLAAAFLLGALAAAAGTVPKGTVISVVTDQPVSSKDAKAGQPVSATVAKNVTIGGKVLIPKGATAKLSVSGVQASGRLSTPAKLYLHLVSVTVKGSVYLRDQLRRQNREGQGQAGCRVYWRRCSRRSSHRSAGGWRQGRCDWGGGGCRGRHGRRCGYGQKRHQVSCRDPAGVYHPNRRGHQVEPKPAKVGESPRAGNADAARPWRRSSLDAPCPGRESRRNELST